MHAENRAWIEINHLQIVPGRKGIQWPGARQRKHRLDARVREHVEQHLFGTSAQIRDRADEQNLDHGCATFFAGRRISYELQKACGMSSTAPVSAVILTKNEEHF